MFIRRPLGPDPGDPVGGASETQACAGAPAGSGPGSLADPRGPGDGGRAPDRGGQGSPCAAGRSGSSSEPGALQTSESGEVLLEQGALKPACLGSWSRGAAGTQPGAGAMARRGRRRHAEEWDPGPRPARQPGLLPRDLGPPASGTGEGVCLSSQRPGLGSAVPVATRSCGSCRARGLHPGLRGSCAL